MSSRDPTTPERALPGKGPSAIDSSPSTRRSELSQEDYSISQSAESATSSHTSDASFASGYSSKKRTGAPGNELDTQGSRSFTKVTAGFGDSVADRKTKEIPKKESTQEPEVIRRIDKCIQDFREGNLEIASWPEFRISHDDYKQWLELHEDDWFVKDKLRFDYFYPDRLLVLRMPTGPRHEFVVDEIRYLIKKQLRKIAKSNSTSSNYARTVRALGSRDVRLGNKSSLQPDASYWYKNNGYPGVIVEVADSQTTKNLHDKAWEYISESKGSVKAVVGLAIDRDDQRAWIKVWRPSIKVDETGETLYMIESNPTTFPKDQTQPIEGEGIRLPLAYFVPGVACDGEIHISPAKLSRLLDDADEEAEVEPVRKRERDEIEANVQLKLGERIIASVEKLDANTEAKFAAIEKKCDEKAEKDAGDTYCERDFDGCRPAKRSKLGR